MCGTRDMHIKFHTVLYIPRFKISGALCAQFIHTIGSFLAQYCCDMGFQIIFFVPLAEKNPGSAPAFLDGTQSCNFAQDTVVKHGTSRDMFCRKRIILNMAIPLKKYFRKMAKMSNSEV